MVEGVAEGAIRAAGGVLWRPAAGNSNTAEVAIIHRPRYDDWSIPKGKLHAGEIELEGAIREVNEETGYRAAIERPLGEIAYLKEGRPKVVRYWAMRAEGGVFIPGREVDELRWLPAHDALELLTQPRDKELLSRFMDGPAVTSTILLVRHGSAGSRSSRNDDDSRRPLDAVGRSQAEALIWFLSRWHIREIVSATPVRCLQTVEPLAAAVGLSVREEDVLGEEMYYGREKKALNIVRAAGTEGTATVICSQGGVIPDMIRRLAEADGHTLPEALPAKKGSIWSLTMADRELFDAEYFPPLS